MNTLPIKFDGFLSTLARALQNASSDRVEIAFCLTARNEFVVIDGSQRTKWQMEMPPKLSDPTWTLYSLLTHIIDFGDDVYTVFNEALENNKRGWIVVIVTMDNVRAEYRDKL